MVVGVERCSRPDPVRSWKNRTRSWIQEQDQASPWSWIHSMSLLGQKLDILCKSTILLNCYSWVAYSKHFCSSAIRDIIQNHPCHDDYSDIKQQIIVFRFFSPGKRPDPATSGFIIILFTRRADPTRIRSRNFRITRTRPDPKISRPVPLLITR